MSNTFAINGRFLMQAVTGVQRVAREALTVFDDMAASGNIPCPRLLVPAQGEMVALPELKGVRCINCPTTASSLGW